ncbi:DNA glycosylase [Aspergillus karnatakaensis]|uniref:putative pre-mRNA splicing factor n=1 Tax=Aspergillus karnatakaensis TaxID=1810916 RepID=UPI003CCDAF9D
MTSGDEVRSKYFLGFDLKNTKSTKRRASRADVEELPSGNSVAEDVRALLDGVGLMPEFLLSDSDLSDVPSDFESDDIDIYLDCPSPTPARSKSREYDDSPATPLRCAVTRDEREQTPLQIDTLSNLLFAEKKPRLKPVRISPYFRGPLVNEDSCLPFPPIETPSFGLVQEQLAHDPFRLLLATIFLNRTRGGVALPVLFQVFDHYPTVEAMAAANLDDLTDMIRCLGFQNQRAKKCIALAQTWLDKPPSRGKRYRKLNYPAKSDGRDVKPTEAISEDDQRIAWEIAHLPGVGAYALDSWRIFCRDELRGLAEDWKGSGAVTSEFVPEWKSVLPLDKELRAYLTWMWLKEGWVWNRESGERTRASEKIMRAARRGATAHIEGGNWVLETSPVKRAVR